MGLRWGGTGRRGRAISLVGVKTGGSARELSVSQNGDPSWDHRMLLFLCQVKGSRAEFYIPIWFVPSETQAFMQTGVPGLASKRSEIKIQRSTSTVGVLFHNLLLWSAFVHITLLSEVLLWFPVSCAAGGALVRPPIACKIGAELIWREIVLMGGSASGFVGRPQSTLSALVVARCHVFLRTPCKQGCGFGEGLILSLGLFFLFG